MRKRGFTLVELMIVIALIGLLAAIIIPNAINYTERQRGSQKQEAEAHLKLFLHDVYPDANVRYAACVKRDTNNDGYIPCTARLSFERGGDLLIGLECGDGNRERTECRVIAASH